MPAVGLRDVLAQRDFRRYAFARFLATITWQMLAVAVGWQVYDITRDPLDLGLIGLAQFLPFLALVLPGGQLMLTTEVENYPEVRLPDWRSFALEVSPPEVTEEMVEKALEELRQRYAELVPVEREAQEKDHLFVRTEEGAEFPIDLAKALPHVREALLGKKAGDVVMVPVLNDKGEKVREVRTEVLEVKTLKLPELDEEFAKTLEAESLEDLKNRVRESLKRQAERAYEEARERAFLEKLAEGLEVEIPPSMLRAEERHLLEHLAEDLYRQGISLEAYLEALKEKGELEKFQEDLRKEAEKRVRIALAREKLAEELNPEVSEEEWQAYLQAAARAYGVAVQDLRRQFGEEGLARLKERLRQDKAVQEALKALG